MVIRFEDASARTLPSGEAASRCAPRRNAAIHSGERAPIRLRAATIFPQTREHVLELLQYFVPHSGQIRAAHSRQRCFPPHLLVIAIPHCQQVT